ncbi:DgyrCDS12680 [Dimorphilus gyrociliatus]|uniref:DgyrCDS12680 n=1 Tax=Dimorphilus gyrociliatus TaxID=2664684 RepID=A0A7I8W7V6_9ANNE|nr:DgyrCDS12680 [Dimorphilus gyrociliatus]
MSEEQEKDRASPSIRQSRLPFQSLNSPTKNEKKRKHINDQGDNKSDSKRRKSGLEFLDQFLKGKAQSQNSKTSVTVKSENEPTDDLSSSEIEESDNDNDNFDNEADVSILSEEPSFISRTDSNAEVQEVSSTSTDTPLRDKNDLKMKKRKTKLTDAEKGERERQKQLRLKEKTEKQRMKKELKERKEEERLKLKEMKLEEKRMKLKEKEEKDIERRQKKEEKEEEKRQRKEAKERARIQKEEQNKQKQEEKRQIEEEKKKLENEKKKRQQKCQAAFLGFFSKAQRPEQSSPKFNKDERFLPFQLGKKQKLAPIYRTNISFLEERLSELDYFLSHQNSKHNYLKTLKSDTYQIGKSEPTWTNKDGDVVLVADEKPTLPWRKAKLFQFHENNRPAYYGTFKKKSIIVTARQPFGKDDNLDYTVDSDEEWEEEEPGESISHSEGEDDDEKVEEGDDDEDDGFFVPHGYLSDDEGCEEDEADEKLNPEKLKARQLAMARKFEEEIKEQPKTLRPLIVGCCWSNSAEKVQAKFLKILKQYTVEIIIETPIQLENICHSTPSHHDMSDCGDSSRKGSALTKPIPKEAMPHLIRFLHGNWNSREAIIREFRQFWSKKSQEGGNESGTNSVISKRQLEIRIKAIAAYDKRTDYKNRCWYVKESVINDYAVTDLKIPNPYAKEMELNNVKEVRRVDDSKKT